MTKRDVTLAVEALDALRLDLRAALERVRVIRQRLTEMDARTGRRDPSKRAMK